MNPENTTGVEERPLTEMLGKVKEYISRLSNLQKQINDTKEGVKDLDEEFKSNGIPISKIKRIVSAIKKELKMSPADKAEMDAFREMILEDPEMLNNISAMISQKKEK